VTGPLIVVSSLEKTYRTKGRALDHQAVIRQAKEYKW